MSTIVTTNNITHSDDVIYDESRMIFTIDEILTNIEFKENGFQYVYSVDEIGGLVNFESFEDTVSGLFTDRTLLREFQLYRDALPFTDWVTDIKMLNSEISPDYNYTLYLRWTRISTDDLGIIKLKEFNVSGNFTYPATPDTIQPGDQKVFTNPDVFKVFKIRDIEIITSQDVLTDDVTIEWRFTQDSGRHFTEWELFTKENVTTAKINKIRFFQVQYRVSNDASNSIDVSDINLIGDFQNVTQDYTKTNLYNIRSDCASTNVNLALQSLNSPPELTGTLSADQLANLTSPYSLPLAQQLFTSLSTSVNQIFGHNVEYFLTSPDGNGIDRIMHEYQLYKVINDCTIQVLVDSNTFPDNQISFNQFDLSLFDTFEIQITKQVFKAAFGEEFRPNKEDFLYFCELGRMYQVEHAQPVRTFNNMAVYYRVVLKKFNHKSNVQPANTSTANRIKELTQNSTVKELIGIDTNNDIIDIANKEQRVTLSQEKTRFKYYSSIQREIIHNASLLISNTHYILNDIDKKKTNVSVVYNKADNRLVKGDNRSFTFWLKFDTYDTTATYNLLCNYDFENNVGYQLNIINNQLVFQLNHTSYLFDISIQTGVWHSLALIVNQRQRIITSYFYKRNVDVEVKAVRLKSSALLLLNSAQQDYLIDEYEFDHFVDFVIKPSVMRLTNIRVFNDIITEDKLNLILNQMIIRDAHYLIIADNANNKPIVTNYPYN